MKNVDQHSQNRFNLTVKKFYFAQAEGQYFVQISFISPPHFLFEEAIAFLEDFRGFSKGKNPKKWPQRELNMFNSIGQFWMSLENLIKENGIADCIKFSNFKPLYHIILNSFRQKSLQNCNQ